MALRYVLDENLRGPVWEALSRANSRRQTPLELSCVGEEADLQLGMADRDLLQWAEEHGFVVVSSDIRTMPVHHNAHLQAGRHGPGVFLLGMPCSIPEVLEALFYYAEESDDTLWRDRITFIP
jgi:hypothetical protein